MKISRLGLFAGLTPLLLAAVAATNACEDGGGVNGNPPSDAGTDATKSDAGEGGTSTGEAGTPEGGADAGAGEGGTTDGGTATADKASLLPTATKIKHLVVIFGENISFDHYFATYPTAQNLGSEVAWEPTVKVTPTPNSLMTPLDPTNGFAPVGCSQTDASTCLNLLTNNPTASNAANGAGAVNPFRLAPSQALTTDQGHNYMPEQAASDKGAMDLFPASTGAAGPPPGVLPAAPWDTTGMVMGYYDGNTVTEMWNLAQNYAMSDNAWTTTFGPSTPGAINLISGQTNGFAKSTTTASSGMLGSTHVVADGNGGYSLIGDVDPIGDLCSTAADQITMAGLNVGDLLNGANVSWGWFEGGFDLGLVNANGTTGCARSNPVTVPGTPMPAYNYSPADYIPHHQPFQYYPTTANPSHARPTSVATIGSADSANHQYDSHDFFDALKAGNFPAVSYLKAPAFQDAHPGYSDPIDEQNFVRQVLSAVQSSGDWSTTLVVITYDDSDGWYDHQAPPIVNPSSTASDTLNGAGMCTSGAQQGDAGAPSAPLKGHDGKPAQGRCGYGTRIPLLVVSPFAKKSYIDHTLLDQTSVLRFVEDNWLGGQRIQTGGSFDTIANPLTNMLSL